MRFWHVLVELSVFLDGGPLRRRDANGTSDPTLPRLTKSRLSYLGLSREYYSLQQNGIGI